MRKARARQENELHASVRIGKLFPTIDQPNSSDRWLWALFQLTNDLYFVRRGLALAEQAAHQAPDDMNLASDVQYWWRLIVAYLYEGTALLFHPKSPPSDPLRRWHDVLQADGAEDALNRLREARLTDLLGYSPGRLGTSIRNSTFHLGEQHLTPVWQFVAERAEQFGEVVLQPSKRYLRAIFLDDAYDAVFLAPHRDNYNALLQDLLGISTTILTSAITELAGEYFTLHEPS